MPPLMSRLSLLFFWSSLLFSAVNAGKGIVRGVGFKPTDTPVEASETIVDIASGSEDLSILVGLVVNAGLAETLSGEGPFTVFAPTNEAFLSVVESVDALMGIGPDTIKAVLAYHVVPGTYLSSDITDGLILTTVQGETIEFGVSDSGITVNEENIGPADIAASNGVIHVIDGIMFPKVLLTPTDPEPPAPVEPAPVPVEPAAGTIVEIATGANPEFSILVDLIVLANLVDVLSGPGPFTVFAPTNAAFAEVIVDIDALDQLDPDIITEILTYHVVPGTIAAANITDGLLLTTVQGETIEFRVNDGVATVNDEGILVTDVPASNGVIHVISGVMFPKSVLVEVADEELAEEGAPATADESEPTIVDLAVSEPDLSILVGLVTGAGLVPTLSGEGPFTVFAPVNAAFFELLNTLGLDATQLGTLDPSVIAGVLSYHVVSGTVLASDITDGLTLPTVQGGTITFAVTDAGVTVNGEQIIATDLAGSNGVVHKIDGVLIPEGLMP